MFFPHCRSYGSWSYALSDVRAIQQQNGRKNGLIQWHAITHIHARSALYNVRCRSTLHLSLHQNRETRRRAKRVLHRHAYRVHVRVCNLARVCMEGIYAYIKDQRGAQSTNQPRSNASSLIIYSGAINPFAFAASPFPGEDLKVRSAGLLPNIHASRYTWQAAWRVLRYIPLYRAYSSILPSILYIVWHRI